MLTDHPLWFKEAIIYEVPVRAYADSNGDGIGDFPGLTEKLPYLQELGITAIWVLPFFPSPLKDDGYDIAEYHSVNPIYGTIEHFQVFLDTAHQLGIRVIIELIVNHTSDQHPWFQRARRAPKNSPERDFYVWSDTPHKYPDVRIIFKDFETSNWTWDTVAEAYYWHRFYSHQPDLNYRHPPVQDAIFAVVDFWLDLGVDGLRLDAVPYLYEEEGTNCENLPETHAFLKKLRAHIDSKYKNRMLLAEANQWPEDAAAYYGDGDECQMNFHFPLMPRLFMALRMEDNFPITDILNQTPTIPDNCQWALFLRNHDELTLEMVSDEDRDYMYRVYAQDSQARINLGIRRRLAPLLGNDRRQIELLNSLLLSLPGTPVLYYGDEIGMGDNIYLGDRNGVRTPMQWSTDRNAGFSRANPQKLYAPIIVDPEYHYETINVEAQQANSNSLWWWMKRLINTRKRHPAFGRGSCELLYPENRKVLAFIRTYGTELMLVVANLSRFVQTTELDLSAFQGMRPIEVFGRTQFPTIDTQPYFISLSPYGCYWFSLQVQPAASDSIKPDRNIPNLSEKIWLNLPNLPAAKMQMASILAHYIYSCNWFNSNHRLVQQAEITEVITLPYQNQEMRLIFLSLNYTDGEPETYVCPLVVEPKSDNLPASIIAYLSGYHDEEKVLLDAFSRSEFWQFPLEAIASEYNISGLQGELVARIITPKMLDQTSNLVPHLLGAKTGQNHLVYGEQLSLKFWRKVEAGINPDLEISSFLSEKKFTEHFAPIVGTIQYHIANVGPTTVAMLQKHIPNTIDAWSYTLDNLRQYIDIVMVQHPDLTNTEIKVSHLVNLVKNAEIPDLAYQVIGTYLGAAKLLGERTAELHIYLSSDSENPDFAPETFSSFYQRSIYQYMRNLAGKTLLSLKKQVPQLTETPRKLAHQVLNKQPQLMDRFGLLLNQKITATRSRCHGDYRLERVLYTGKDFIIVDFEGEVNRPLSERRMKRSPLRDVAGILESFYHAVNLALQIEINSGIVSKEMISSMEKWADFWYNWVSVSFLQSYLSTANHSSFIPESEVEMRVLLDAYLLEKAITRLNSELNAQSDHLSSYLRRILTLLS